MIHNQVEVEIFLEHFGIKGQKWGTRKNSDLDDSNKNKDSSDHRKFKKAAKIGGVAVAGAVVAAIILHKYKDIKVKNLRLSNEKFVSAKKLID